MGVAGNRSLDVLVNCYASWCGHSRKLHGVFETIASNLSHVKTLKLARIECTQNDIPVHFEGVPAVLLFPGGARKNQIVRYMGKKTLEDMTEWLHVHSTYNFTATAPEMPSA